MRLQLQLTAEAAPVPIWSPNTTDPIAIAMCVMNLDGTPRSGLTQNDFKVFQLVGPRRTK